MTSSSTTAGAAAVSAAGAAAVSAAGTAAVVDGDVVVQGSCVMVDKLSCGIALHDDQQLKVYFCKNNVKVSYYYGYI